MNEWIELTLVTWGRLPLVMERDGARSVLVFRPFLKGFILILDSEASDLEKLYFEIVFQSRKALI